MYLPLSSFQGLKETVPKAHVVLSCSSFSQTHKVGNVGIIEKFVLPCICSCFSLFAPTGVNKSESINQIVHEKLHFKVTHFIEPLDFYFITFTKLAMLAFLYCGQFVKTLLLTCSSVLFKSSNYYSIGAMLALQVFFYDAEKIEQQNLPPLWSDLETSGILLKCAMLNTLIDHENSGSKTGCINIISTLMWFWHWVTLACLTRKKLTDREIHKES